MDTWSERIGNSPLKGATKEIESLAQQIAAPDGADEFKEMLQRQSVVARHVRTRVYGADPRLIPEEYLSAIETLASQIQTHLTSFKDTFDANALLAADAASEKLLAELAAIPPTRRSDSDADAISSILGTIADVERRAASTVANMEAAAATAVQATTSAIADADAQIDSLLGESLTEAAAIRAAVAAIKAELENSKATYDQELTAQKTRIDTFIQTGQAQLTTLQSDALSQRDALAKEFADAAELQRSDWELRLAPLFEGVEKHLDFFATQESRVNRILGATAASETAGTYLEESGQQRKEANVWRWLSFIIWLAAVGVAIWSAHEVTSSVSDVSGSRLIALSSARLAVAAIALSFALWVSGQSGHHRRREQDARTIASELTTLRPFLAELPEDKLQESLSGAFGLYFPGKPDRSARTSEKK